MNKLNSVQFVVLYCLATISQFAQAEIYYYHNDHLGTPQVMTDANQQVVWEVSRKPFGDSKPIVEVIENNLGFPGQYFDEETGLYYNMARDYDPSIGRYIQSDPIGLEGSLNIYAYVDNDPLNYYDPEGKVKRKCPRNVYLILRGAVVASCKAPTSCKASDSCNALKAKIAIKRLCILAQEALTNTCFPGDKTHEQRIQDEMNGIRKCEGFKATCDDC